MGRAAWQAARRVRSGRGAPWRPEAARSMMNQVLKRTVLCLLALAPFAPSADRYFPPPDAKGGWRTLTDPAAIEKSAGLDKQKLEAAFDYVQTTTQHGGLLVVRHGYLVYERYFGRGDREALPELASCGKSFT